MSRMKNEIAEAFTPSAAEAAEQGIVGTYCFSSEFTGFDGHFPGMPILPAIVQIMIGRHAAEHQASCFFSLVAVKNAKYLKPIEPDMQISALVERSAKDADVYVVKLMLGEETASSFRLHLLRHGAAGEHGEPGERNERA